jgi:hypothetical protein
MQPQNWRLLFEMSSSSSCFQFPDGQIEESLLRLNLWVDDVQWVFFIAFVEPLKFWEENTHSATPLNRK